MLKIEILTNEQVIGQHSLRPGSYRLGKSDLCDIRLMDAHVSRHHANLVVSERGAYISDAGSTNGTWKDAKRITRYGALKAGDCFQLGNLTLRVGYADSPGGAEDLSDSNELPAGEELDSLNFKYVPANAGFDKTGKMAFSENGDVGAMDVVLSEPNLDLTVVPAAVPEAEPEDVFEDIGEAPPDKSDHKLLGLLMKDENVDAIMINGPDRIFVERDQQIERMNARFDSVESLVQTLSEILPQLRRRAQGDSPIINTRLSDGTRVHAVLPPAVKVGPVVTIRKSSRLDLGLDGMVAAGMMNRQIAEFLEVCTAQRRNIIVAGVEGSGRTTMLEALAKIIPVNERVIAIEESADLRLSQNHVVSLGGKGGVPLKQLTENMRYMRPDRVILSECRGPETFDFLHSTTLGVSGLLSTIYGGSAKEALQRLEMLASLQGYSSRSIKRLIVSAVDIIIHMQKYGDGKHRVSTIVEVDDIHKAEVSCQRIFEFRESRESNGATKGVYCGCDYVPTFFAELEAQGAKLNRAIFRGTAQGSASKTRH